MQNIKDWIVEIPDFPKPGIVFRDISPLLKYRFVEAVDAICALFSAEEWRQIDCIAGIESRGFLFAAPLAYQQRKGLVPIRKLGKLPKAAGQMRYGLEYGKDVLEMQKGDGERLLIIDDVMATGGSMTAAADLAQKVGYQVAAIATLINLSHLNNFSWQGLTCRPALTFFNERS